MGCVDAQVLSALFLLPETIAIDGVYPTTAHLTIQVRCVLKSASCPLCQHPSERIHSSYGRRVADVPCGGRRVTLALTVRKFVCNTPECPRKIFTERLPELVQSYACMTNRLSSVLQALGFATCGQLGERLVPTLGMAASGPTLLRRMRALCLPPPSCVRILGIDDWAWRKGQTYGTILVDLETRRPIDLLPDRSTETVAAWLRRHPEVEIVSRDRGGEYAAAKQGAPQAQQVADRFHLVKNLRERLKELMDRRQSCLPEVEEQASDAIPAKAQGIKDKRPHQSAEPSGDPDPEKHYRTIPPFPYQRPPGMSYEAFQKQVRRDKRVTRYEDVRTLFEQGLSQRAIARKLKLSRKTVGKFVQAEQYPERHASKAGASRSLLDLYKGYLLLRWQQGCRNSVQLYDEIKARGFKGSAPLLRKFLAELRKKHQQAGSASVLTFDTSTQTIEIPPDLPPKPRIVCRLSATRASWLFVNQAGKLDAKQTQHVEQIRAAHPDLEKAYHLSQEFVMMLAERRAADLENWLTQADKSGLPEFKKMASGIRQDYAALEAAFASQWSNGQVEAQVNRLKLQKRIMFGRANFDLLRLRVLCRA